MPSGNLTEVEYRWPISSMFYQSKIVIFHSRVKLPDGTAFSQ